MGKILNYDIERKDRAIDVRSKVVELLTQPLPSCGDRLYLQVDKRGIKVGLKDSGEWAIVGWETLLEEASEPLEGDAAQEWGGIIEALRSEGFVQSSTRSDSLGGGGA